MQWSKPFVSILLLVVSVLVVRSSSTNRVENNTGWLKENLKEIGEKQHYEANKRNPITQAFKRNTNGFVLNAEADQLKLDNGRRRLHSTDSSLVIVASKEHINNRIEPQGTKNQFSETPQVNYPERQKQNSVSGKQTRLQSDIINRKLSKHKANLPEFSNLGKRVKKKIVSSHRIAKRNIYMSNPLAPSFNIPPECSGEKSCSGRCTGNITEWRSDETLACYCDTACYEIFNDCCSDYTKYCGEQKPCDISIKKFKWTCEPLGHFRSNQHCEIGEGLRMVSRCVDDWPRDRIRRKCENPAKFLQKPLRFKRYIPVAIGNVTFRNYFCAECNRIAGKFEYFPVEIKTNVIPPEHHNFKGKVDFLLSHDAEFPRGGPWTPKTSQKRRYCLKSIVDLCPGNTTSESCTNGSVEPVSGAKSFKNYNCARCNHPGRRYSCFPPILPSVCHFTPPQRFLLNLDYQKKSLVFSVLSTSCSSKGLIFDHKLQECVQDIPPASGNEGKIRVLVWFAPSKTFQFSENDFKTVIKQYFGVEHSQIYNVTIDTVPKKFRFRSSTILFIGSTLLLTPEQLFDILFKNDSKSSILNLRSFIHFNKPLNVTLNNITYTIIKTTSRPLSCNTRINGYTREEFMMGVIHITPTYEKVNYDRKVYGNITMCEEEHPRQCKPDQTGLTKKDFVINANLSIYHKETGVLYKFGQYDVTGDSIVLCNLEQFNVSTSSSENSCKGRCSNHTELRTGMKMHCSCEPDCYEVFNDCCSDYTKYCGVQMPTETLTKKYNYICEEFAVYAPKQDTGSAGLWMVTQCRPEWPDGTSRTKFEAPAGELNMSSPDPFYLPVLGHDNTTFRNLSCAVCNDVNDYEPGPLHANTYYVIPPEYYNFTERIRFLLSHGGEFSEQWQRLGPGANQTRRYCLKQFIIDSCPLGEKFESCANGDVALMRVGQRYYKNTHCAACHSWPSEIFSCFSGKYLQIDLDKDLEVYALLLRSMRSILDYGYASYSYASYGYDIGFYSHDHLVKTEEIREVPLLNAYVICAMLEPPSNSQNSSFTPTEFQESLTRYLNISQSQLIEINITTVLRPETISSSLYLVSSTILLTSQQRSELLHTNRSDKISTKTKLLMNYIYYSEPFILQIKGLSYTVTKTTPHPLACVEKTTYTPEGYTLQEQDRVLIRSTNKTYGKFEYYRENVEKLDGKPGNITVCEKYIPTKCNGSTVLYTAEEYSIMVNLSIFVKKTSSLYDCGEYEILSNKSVAICQYFKVFIISKPRQTIRNNKVLDYITFISFLLSILFLIFLLVTYILFPHLRTLPGKNLMNFAASLLLFYMGWLLLNINEIRSDEPLCNAMAVIEHYFLMTSFVSMSVIAFHTCKIFARSLPAPKMSEGHKRKLFCAYLALVWLLPGIFGGICVVLDNQDVVKIGYGESEICWLTEDNAYTYFVIIPIAVLLLFNVIAFVTAAIYLRKHGQNKAAKQASGNKRSNFLIYVKLSTLMGFTWLFGLLALVVKSTTVFWYFFVIFTSLQGVFVAMSFVLNAKTFGLYKQWYRSGSRSPKTDRQKRNGPTKV